ncbi:hypothetical protein FACS189454_02410 [Planctomycetales bacterium]|nr:hypothetical protein FACS189454_02410 [Planctomycetales bacterium]
MRIDNFSIRSVSKSKVSLSWTSERPELWSWIFLNGKLLAGPYMPDSKERGITFPVPADAAFVIEIDDEEGIEVVPESAEEAPLIKPTIAWNESEEAVSYKIYHSVFDTNASETLLATMPARFTGRVEIDCPARLNGRDGHWHTFRVEAVDSFGNESVSELLPYFAADLPLAPSLTISRNIETGLFSFRINKES